MEGLVRTLLGIKILEITSILAKTVAVSQGLHSHNMNNFRTSFEHARSERAFLRGIWNSPIKRFY